MCGIAGIVDYENERKETMKQDILKAIRAYAPARADQNEI